MVAYESRLWHKQKDASEAARIGQQLSIAQLQKNDTRRELSRRHAAMFEGVELSGLDADAFESLNPITYDNAPLVNNRAASIVETLQSKLAALDEPRPQFVVTDGTYEQQRQAFWLDRFVEALYYQAQCNGMYSSLWAMWRHAFLLAAAASGSVAIKIFPDFNAKKIQCELRTTMDMWVDARECRTTGPVTYGDVTWVDAEPLLDKYRRNAKKQQAILSAAEEEAKRLSVPVSGYHYNGLQVRVHELYRVRTTADEPGKYLQCVGNEALEYADFEYSTPPFAFYHFRRRLGGFWGASSIDRYYQSVIRENQVLNRRDEGEARSSTLVIHYDPNVEGAKQMARPGHVLYVPYDSTKGPPPQPYVMPWYPQTAPELQAAHAQNSHDSSGVAAMQVTGTAQQGLTAAVAIRTVLSLLNERLAPQQRDIVQATAVDSAYLLSRAAQELYQETGKFDAVWYGKGVAKTMPGSDCLELPREIMTVQVRPVSEKKNSPQDRLQLAQELVAQGVISGGHWLGLLKHMDTISASKMFEKTEQWAEDFVEKVRYAPEKDLNKPGFYQAPLKSMDLDFLMAKVTDAVLDAQLAKTAVPENRKALLLKMLGDVDSKIVARDARRQAMQQPPAPIPVPGQAPPVAA